MPDFFRMLFLIYLNRFRKLTYGDSGPFYFLSFIYIIGLWKLIDYEEVYSKIIFIFFIFIQNTILLERNDFPFLKKQLGSIKSYLFIVLDLFFFNIIILFCILFKEFFIHFILSLALIFLMSLLLFLKKINYHFKLPFSTIDPLWINFIRRKPWALLILITTYFIQYQGLENKNSGLFYAASFGITYFVLQIYTDKEKLLYLKLSKKNIKIYLLESLKNNIINTLYLFLPSLLLQLNYRIFSFEFLFQIIFSISFAFYTRYLFYENKIMQGIIYFASLFLLFYLQKEISFTVYVIIIFFTNIILYKLTSEKLQKIIDSYKN
ncbi:hypothetical protein [Chryseobacterium fistulae]|uniref:Uncharacterized protein n=1 Tax=Chryseobacterium fistulae TaxID=2675058 RepID=A0A6N4XSZ2_9FLAO|nr:hypothetical protein [Chryseobacterium fistulae]CAA7392584.1 hypothetical protein CHRY9393_03306 [Chryseobacterium fistulae]